MLCHLGILSSFFDRYPIHAITHCFIVISAQSIKRQDYCFHNNIVLNTIEHDDTMSFQSLTHE